MARVLVVEDDPLVREAVERTVRAGGHEIVGAASSLIEARNVLGSLVEFDVAVLDGRIPNEGDGERLALDIRQRFPDVKIISLAGQEESFGDVNLVKPLGIQRLLQTIDELLS